MCELRIAYGANRFAVLVLWNVVQKLHEFWVHYMDSFVPRQAHLGSKCLQLKKLSVKMLRSMIKRYRLRRGKFGTHSECHFREPFYELQDCLSAQSTERLKFD